VPRPVLELLNERLAVYPAVVSDESGKCQYTTQYEANAATRQAISKSPFAYSSYRGSNKCREIVNIEEEWLNLFAQFPSGEPDANHETDDLADGRADRDSDRPYAEGEHESEGQIYNNADAEIPRFDLRHTHRFCRQINDRVEHWQNGANHQYGRGGGCELRAGAKPCVDTEPTDQCGSHREDSEHCNPVALDIGEFLQDAFRAVPAIFVADIERHGIQAIVGHAQHLLAEIRADAVVGDILGGKEKSHQQGVQLAIERAGNCRNLDSASESEDLADLRDWQPVQVLQ